MDPLQNRRMDDRQGVALILVIGMLALMMVMGVTFSIFMRTERLAAGNFVKGLQNRELLQVALSRALDNIETSVSSKTYPPWDVVMSPGTSLYTNALNGSITNWVATGAFIETAPTDVKPGWIQIPVPGYGNMNVAYVVLNCSGLLDANYAGGGNRGSGTSPEEIELSEVLDANKGQYKAGRPYATQQDLAARGGVAGPAQALVTYSAYPNSYVGGTNRALVDISGDETAIKGKKGPIMVAFKASIPGSSDADALFFYNNLLDYVDADDVPQDLGSPCTERVPMVNEVRAQAFLADVNPGGKSCTSAIAVETEWYYPFVANSADSFTMVVDVVITNNNAASAKYVPASTQLSFPNLACAPGLAKSQAPDSPFSVGVSGCSTGDVISLSASVGVRILNKDNKVVDSVPYPYLTNKFLKIDFPDMTFPSVAPADVVGGEWHGFECKDPRFNWDTSEDYWFAYPDLDGIVGEGSMDSTNKIVTQLKANAPTEYDLFSDMYVADAPLKNVGELSFLLRSQDSSMFWNTFKLSADQRQWPIDRLLDHFVLGSEQTRRGLLNVNSRSSIAWTDLFSKMPFDKYPGQVGAPVATPDQAAEMAVAMTNFVNIPLGKLSDFGLATNLVTVAGMANSSTLKQRSVLRNISSLIDIRQQYYIVLLYGSPKKVSGLGEVASIQGVAEVWRDPLPRSDGVHPKFVRMFKVVDAW